MTTAPSRWGFYLRHSFVYAADATVAEMEEGIEVAESRGNETQAARIRAELEYQQGKRPRKPDTGPVDDVTFPVRLPTRVKGVAEDVWRDGTAHIGRDGDGVTAVFTMDGSKAKGFVVRVPGQSMLAFHRVVKPR